MWKNKSPEWKWRVEHQTIYVTVPKIHQKKKNEMVMLTIYETENTKPSIYQKKNYQFEWLQKKQNSSPRTPGVEPGTLNSVGSRSTNWTMCAGDENPC